jgi:hypothetical protein
MVSKTYSFLLLFEFEMPNDVSDNLIAELGDEVTANLRSFFQAKRRDPPTVGSLTIIRGEETDVCEPKRGN